MLWFLSRTPLAKPSMFSKVRTLGDRSPISFSGVAPTDVEHIVVQNRTAAFDDSSNSFAPLLPANLLHLVVPGNRARCAGVGSGAPPEHLAVPVLARGDL